MVVILEAKRLLQEPGEIEEFGVLGLFRIIESASENGCLTLSFSGQKHKVWFRRGKLIAIDGSLTIPMARALLVGNKFMTESIFGRFEKRYKSPDKAFFLHYLLEQYLLNPQQYDEVARLLTEWQALALVGRRDGEWSFESVDLATSYQNMPGLQVERLQWRLTQLFTDPRPVSDHFSWERPLDFSQGRLQEVPLLALLQAIKAAGSSGVLKLPGSARLGSLYFDHGILTTSVEVLMRALALPSGRFSFARKPKLKFPLSCSAGAAKDTYQRLFSDDPLQTALLKRRQAYERSRESMGIREVTNLRAWTEVKIENAWLMVKPALAWFVPLAAPMLLTLVYVRWQERQSLTQVGEAQALNRNVYEISNQLLQRLGDRQLDYSNDKALEFREGQAQIKMVSEARSNLAVDQKTVEMHRLLIELPGGAQGQIEIFDLAPEAPRAKLLMSAIELP